MKYRKLRIAWSVGCGIGAVLLCVLWVRSYYQIEDITFREEHRVTSFNGHVYLDATLNPKEPNYFQNQVTFTVRKMPWRIIEIRRLPLRRVTFETDDFGVPYGLLLLVASFVGVSPWLPIKRFSLRTLLVATTLVAVVLGLIAWSIK